MKKGLLAIAIVLVIGGGVFFLTRRTPKTMATIQGPAPAAAGPAEVVLTGHVEARTVLPVQAPIDGTLEAFFVEPGAEVIQGQLLGKVKDPKGDAAGYEAQQALDEAQRRAASLASEQLATRLELSRTEAERTRLQGEVERLKKTYERQKGLWDVGATARLAYEKSQRDYEDAKAALEKQDGAGKEATIRADAVTKEIAAVNQEIEARKAAVEGSKNTTASGEVHSPADGIVIARSGQPGDAVTTASKLMDIATDLTSLQVVAQTDPAILARIQPGLPATLRINDQDIAGVVQEVRGTDVVIYFTSAEPVHTLGTTVQARIKF
jgi:multidrug resistance efflux pump